MVRAAAVVALTIVLGGCSSFDEVSAGDMATPYAAKLVPLSAGLAMLTLPQTKKTPIDLIVSNITDRDCSIVGYEQTGRYCKDAQRKEVQHIYCIKTLGDVECHHKNDPYYGGERKLASAPPVYTGEN